MLAGHGSSVSKSDMHVGKCIMYHVELLTKNLRKINIQECFGIGGIDIHHHVQPLNQLNTRCRTG